MVHYDNMIIIISIILWLLYPSYYEKGLISLLYPLLYPKGHYYG